MKSHLAKPKFDAQMQKDLYRQVIGMASNLNQIAHKINTDSHAFSDSEFSALRQEVQDLLRQLK
ncbi:hypothetical protein FC80_GL000421 [Liquorilactobacillus cacaonum DSM 21116]|uniref:Bacterial mobilisation domain-containing protein n=2 Tax=Liquorilactobacillus cacaonum TaxID=483012 RepID=A0A0R2CXZ1_9LACO|nr:hypothetical protein FC80_GL000421 [Liquorilactobacillus cacaonum DSM 21116]